MFRPIQNSNTFQKQSFKGNMEKSPSANLFSIFKLDASMGMVGSLKEWTFNTNTKMLAELLTSTDGVALLNSLAKASNKEQKLKIFETSSFCKCLSKFIDRTFVFFINLFKVTFFYFSIDYFGWCIL